MAANGKRVRLLVLVALLAATSSSCASTLDLANSQGSNGRKFLFESEEQMFTTNSFLGASMAQQERVVREWAANRPNVDLTPGTFSMLPRSTPLPPDGQDAGRNKRSFPTNQPNFEFSPGTFSTKPRNTPVPPHGPAPGEHTQTFFSRLSGAQQEINCTPGTIFERPLNPPAPPQVGSAPGLFGMKPWKTPVSPIGAAPGHGTNTYFSRVSGTQKEIDLISGTFSEKPCNTPVPPVEPAPGIDSRTYFSRVSPAQQEREVNEGFNRGGAILLP